MVKVEKVRSKTTLEPLSGQSGNPPKRYAVHACPLSPILGHINAAQEMETPQTMLLFSG